jgi:hypothetical protein
MFKYPRVIKRNLKSEFEYHRTTLRQYFDAALIQMATAGLRSQLARARSKFRNKFGYVFVRAVKEDTQETERYVQFYLH